MKRSMWMCVVLAIVAFSGVAKGQAPAGATGQCKDGTYSNAASKSGACSGHKGVQTWYAQNATGTKPANAAPQKSAASPAQTPAGPVLSQAAPARTQAAPVPQTGPQPAAPAATAQSAPAQRSSTATAAQAPGGGPGMVWVNTSSKVYHCSGDAYYGKTKAGKYVTEDAAKSEGDRPDHNKPCAR